jgi:hypothetical protein
MFESGRGRAVSARPREVMFEMDLSTLFEGLRSTIKLVIAGQGMVRFTGTACGTVEFRTSHVGRTILETFDVTPTAAMINNRCRGFEVTFFRTISSGRYGGSRETGS